MAYTVTLEETLKDENGTLYKVLQLKILDDLGKFSHQSESMIIRVTDGTHEAVAFSNWLSGNQKELYGIFTTDAFSGFSTNSTIQFGTNDLLMTEITGFNPGVVVPLPPLSGSPTYITVDNYWLANH